MTRRPAVVPAAARRVLVTGASGFVMGHVVDQLAQQGDEVVAFDLVPPSSGALACWRSHRLPVRIVEGDVTDAAMLNQLVGDLRIDVIVHGATIVPAPELELDDPRPVLEVGILGTAAVLRAAGCHRVRRMIFISSASVYDSTSANAAPLTEAARLASSGTYALVKLAGEWMTRQVGRGGRTETASARLAATFGPLERETSARTELSPIWRMIRLARSDAVMVLGSPDHLLDFTYVKDVASAVSLLTTAEHLGHDTYNVSNGIGHTLAEIAELVIDAVGTGALRAQSDDRTPNVNVPKTLRRGVLDTRRLNRDTHFEPMFSMSDALEDYAAWLDRYSDEACAGGGK